MVFSSEKKRLSVGAEQTFKASAKQQPAASFNPDQRKAKLREPDCRLEEKGEGGAEAESLHHFRRN